MSKDDWGEDWGDEYEDDKDILVYVTLQVNALGDGLRALLQADGHSVPHDGVSSWIPVTRVEYSSAIDKYNKMAYQYELNDVIRNIPTKSVIGHYDTLVNQMIDEL